MKVLFCTDGSDASYHALQKVMPFLKKNSLIDILYVADWGYFPTYVTFPVEEELFVSSNEVAKIIIGKTEEILNTMGFSVNSKEYKSGNPASEILEAIRSGEYNLVVMGSHGKKGIENWLGSVSRKIVTGSNIPVFIARPSKNENIITLKEKYKVLMAVDGSSFSYNAIEKCIELFDLSLSFIDLLTVKAGLEALPLEITMDAKWLDSCLQKQKEIADDILENASNVIKEKNLSVRNSIELEGNAAEEILNISKNENYDIIVMGSHGREGLSEFLLGSVSKRVLNNSHSPILIVPTKKSPD